MSWASWFSKLSSPSAGRAVVGTEQVPTGVVPPGRSSRSCRRAGPGPATGPRWSRGRPASRRTSTSRSRSARSSPSRIDGPGHVGRLDGQRRPDVRPGPRACWGRPGRAGSSGWAASRAPCAAGRLGGHSAGVGEGQLEGLADAEERVPGRGDQVRPGGRRAGHDVQRGVRGGGRARVGRDEVGGVRRQRRRPTRPGRRRRRAAGRPCGPARGPRRWPTGRPKLSTVGASCPRVVYPRKPFTSTDTVPPRFRSRQSTSSEMPPGWSTPLTANGVLLKNTVVYAPPAGRAWVNLYPNRL